MLRAAYILIIFCCTQIFAVGQDSDIKELLNQALEISDDSPKKSIDLTKQAFNLARKQGNTYRMVSAKNVMGYISMTNYDYEAAYLNYTDALAFLERSDTVDLYNQVSILNNLAIIRSIYADHNGSAIYYEQAHEIAKIYIDEYRSIAEAEGELSLLIDLPYEMAVQLKSNGEYMRAGEVLVDLWEKSEFQKDTIMLAKVVNQLGLIKMVNKEYTKAQDFFSMAAFNEDVEPTIRAMAMHNLAETYLEQDDYRKAKAYLDIAFELKQEHADEYSQFITMMSQGQLALKVGDTEGAVLKWETALSTYDRITSDPELFVIYDLLQKAYLGLDIDKAGVYGALYTENIGNWMAGQKNQTENPTLQAFNTRIDTIMADRALKAERLDLLRQYWPLGVVALLMVMLFVYVVQLNFNKRRERILEQNLKVDRASVADEILNKIRRD